jgi:tRNA uridine 5-carboxymethylaminomethyl modification enzyme
MLDKKQGMERLGALLRTRRLMPTAATNERLTELGLEGIKNPTTLEELLKRPGVTLGTLHRLDGNLNSIKDDVAYQVELDVKYRGYTDRQTEMISRASRLEDRRIPPDMSYSEIPGLSREVIEKLSKIKPVSLGQASRISGVTPAAVNALLIHFKKRGLL